jgi:hypothetical protein
VVPRSRQPRQQAAETRRCQVAEETRGPRGGRAQEGRSAPAGKFSPDPLTANAQSLRLRLGAKVYLEIKIYESSSSSHNQKQALALTS